MFAQPIEVVHHASRGVMTMQNNSKQIRRSGSPWMAWLIYLVSVAGAPLLQAQGQDSTAGERNLRIMAELLPGHYDNANQHYFDQRRKLAADDQHVRMSTTIRRVNAPAFGRYAYLWINEVQTATGAQRSWRIASLHAGPASDEVTMQHHLRMQGEITEAELATLTPAQLRRTEGCDYRFKRRADHFRGLQESGRCEFEWEGQRVRTDNEISISKSSLWFHDHKWVIKTGRRITGVASGEPYWLERSRDFHCYADIPGVGGGRDIPFKRYDDITLHDKGGMFWFKTDEDTPREIGLQLRAVTWHVLNEANDYFNRNSMVLSVLERLGDGSVKEHAYAFTDPQTERIALNLKWILANCAITPRQAAKPEM